MHVLKNYTENPVSPQQKLPKFLVAAKQKTILKKISIQGIGLHTGKKVSMTINPAPADTGYTFRIIRNNKKIQIQALYDNVKSTELCTLISDNRGNFISTVEHILSALYGLEMTTFIDLDSNEVPVCDGSSSVFVIIKNGRNSRVFQKYKN